MNTKDYLRIYARERPLFLSMLRAKEVTLYQHVLPLKHPVLDIGCGDGFFARVTFGKGRIDTGVDLKESRMNEIVPGTYKQCVSYDGYTLPFPNRSFQTVVVNSVLEHVDDLPRVVSEIARVLRPGGMCITTVMASPWEQYLFGSKLFGNRYTRWMKQKQVHVNVLSFQEWSRVFLHAKLKPKETIPYLSKRAGALLDILHYVSVPSLISYALTKKWVLWPVGWFPMRYLAGIMDDTVSRDEAGALFFVLKR